MGSSYFAFNKHVIYVYLYIFFDLVLENFIHQGLVSGIYIFKTKQHDLIAKKASVSNESNFFSIFLHLLEPSEFGCSQRMHP